MIKLEHLSKTFQTSSGEIEAVSDVSLTVEKGDIFGIIGLSRRRKVHTCKMHEFS